MGPVSEQDSFAELKGSHLITQVMAKVILPEFLGRLFRNCIRGCL